MKRILFTCILAFSVVCAWAQSAPKWTKKVQKSIVSVLAYGKDGKLLHSGTGFYIDANGTAVADYSILRDAYSASVVDASGNKSNVVRILGADDTYGLVRFTTDAKKPVPLAIATEIPHKGSSLWTLSFSKDKITECPVATLKDTTMVMDSCAYYTLTPAFDSKYVGCPLFNSDGELVATVQPSVQESGYALDKLFATSLRIHAVQTRSANLTLDNIHIRKGLPETAEEALVYIYFKSTTASNEDYLDMLNLFVDTYPDNPEGYVRRATPLMDTYQFDAADSDLQKYLELSADKDKAHSSVSSLLYTKLLYQPDSTYSKWNFDVALDHIDKAIELNPKLEYKYQKGQILMAKKDYDAAYNLYDAINRSADRSPASYYAASLVLDARGDTVTAQIELLDSALAMFPDPMPADAANYVLRRGKLYERAGIYRKAVLDYNKFCYLSNNQVNANFYYDRSVLETKARMYQQAVDDINMAVSTEPNNILFLVEKCALMLRVNMLDECVETARKCISLDPSNSDAYRMLGYALLQKDDKAGALENLNKAVQLGDEGAKEIINTYMK